MFIFYSVADAAAFGLDDLLNFTFAVNDVVLCATDGPVLDEVAGLKGIFRTCSGVNGDWSDLELSGGSWHDDDMGKGG